MPVNPYPTYQSREAMLRALQGGGGVVNNQQPQMGPPAYTYPDRNQIQQGRYPTTSTAGRIADIGAGLAPTVARQFAPQVATSLAEGGMKAAGMGGAASMGLGLATELGGSLLKPKQDLPTASPFPELTDQYTRRQEGSGEGILGGATKWGGRGAQLGSMFLPGPGTAIGAGIGALAGGIANAFTKNAKSAATDFSRDDAIRAISQMYATQGGRLPTPEEVEQILVGQGAKPGSKFVGEKGLYSVLNSLSGNFAKERQGAVEDPDAPVTTPEAAAGMNQNPQQVRTGPDGRPIPDSGPGGMTGRPSDNVYGPAGNTALGNGAQGVLPGDVVNAGTPAPSTVDQSKWNTDQYAKPAYIAEKPGKVMPGFNEKKWNDPNHQTPKYVVGRILSQIPVGTENMDRAVAEIAKAYPGARRTGSGDVTIPGVGSMDILVGADVGGKRWHAGSASGGGKKGGGGKAGVDTSGIQSARDAAGGYADAARGYAEGGDIATGNDIASILKRLGQYSGNPGLRGVNSARDAVLRGLR